LVAASGHSLNPAVRLRVSHEKVGLSMAKIAESIWPPPGGQHVGPVSFPAEPPVAHLSLAAGGEPENETILFPVVSP